MKRLRLRDNKYAMFILDKSVPLTAGKSLVQCLKGGASLTYDAIVSYYSNYVKLRTGFEGTPYVLTYDSIQEFKIDWEVIE